MLVATSSLILRGASHLYRTELQITGELMETYE